jgi:hypothetical protein
MLDTATPPSTRLSAEVFLPIQPAVVHRAFQRVYARLFEPEEVAVDSDDREVPIHWVIPNAATLKVTMVRGLVFRI